MVRDLAPDIVRQRLLLEGYWTGELTADRVKAYLLGVAERLSLRTYGEPIVFSPDSGMGRSENAGFDAFVPLIDSGISGYFWAEQQFFSVVIYSCKKFEAMAATDFTRGFFRVTGEIVSHGF